MRKTIAIILAVALCMTLAGCTRPNTDNHTFDFKIDFGIMGRNCIDTYNNTFTKDLVVAGQETIDFVIPDDKMQEFREAFVKYKIDKLPGDINAEIEIIEGETYMETTPASSYTLTYTYNNETRTIVCHEGGPWLADSAPPDTCIRLVAFVDTISAYIFSTDAYKQMSPSEGGYD